MGQCKKSKINNSKATETASGDKSADTVQSKSQPSATTIASSINTQPEERYAFNPTNHLPFPPEIRNKIYHYVLSIQSCLQSTSSMHLDYSWSVYRVRPIDTSLLLVSKQTYLETWHIFYTLNTLDFDSTDALLEFLKGIGYARRQQIVSVAFRWQGKDPKAAFRLLKTCSRLENIMFNLCYLEPKGYAALREVRGMKKVTIHRQRCGNCLCTNTRWAFILDMHQDLYELSDPMELKEAMMRPRLKRYEPKEDEEFDLFKPKREIFCKSEEHWLGCK